MTILLVPAILEDYSTDMADLVWRNTPESTAGLGFPGDQDSEAAYHRKSKKYQAKAAERSGGAAAADDAQTGKDKGRREQGEAPHLPIGRFGSYYSNKADTEEEKKIGMFVAEQAPSRSMCQIMPWGISTGSLGSAADSIV